jgi:threonyl-tRNA synthetase
MQVVVLNITDRLADYATRVGDALCEHGVRVKADLRNEKIGFKIREHTLQRVPYLLIVGDREAEANTVAVRTRGGTDLGSMSLQIFEKHLDADIASRGRSI